MRGRVRIITCFVLCGTHFVLRDLLSPRGPMIVLVAAYKTIPCAVAETPCLRMGPSLLTYSAIDVAASAGC